MTTGRILRYSQKARIRPNSQPSAVLIMAISSGSRHSGTATGVSLNWLLTRFSESPRASE
ncbi:Uncharacterised protein [Bordetella pertussis]|nr:Uncharacterised protein [Bordetella pertussis]